MKTRILALFLVLLFVLAGCAQKPASGPVVPMSSQYEDTTEDITSDDTTSDTTDSTSSDKKVTYEADGGSDVFVTLLGEEESGGKKGYEMVVEKNTIPATLSTKWDASSTTPLKTTGAEEEKAAARKNVINTKNTSEYHKWSGKTYYISPDGDDNNDGLTPKTAVKTLDADAIYMNPLQPGDALLFERGGVWRMTSSIYVRKGVTYGSYGTGEKPTLVGSMKNYADPELWTAGKKQNVWKLTVSDKDIGIIVFNHGEFTGWKKYNGITVLENNCDYYYNNKDETVYLYFDKGNPGEYFDSIEVGLSISGFTVEADDVVIDNIRIKYCGRFGMEMGGNDNATITNCEIGFVGGTTQRDTTRFGNGIQQWGTTDKQYVNNNWIYQCYDSGYTWQGADGSGRSGYGAEVYYKNITVTNNIIEYCIFAIECFHTVTEDGEFLGDLENFILSDNIFVNSGYGWSDIQRYNRLGYHVRFGDRYFPTSVGCKITNNIFDVSRRSLVRWSFKSGANNGEWEIGGNTFYHTKSELDEGMSYGPSVVKTTDQSTLSAAVSAFDKTPKLVKWLS